MNDSLLQIHKEMLAEVQIQHLKAISRNYHQPKALLKIYASLVRKQPTKTTKYLGKKLSKQEKRYILEQLVHDSDFEGIQAFRRTSWMKTCHKVSAITHDLKS